MSLIWEKVKTWELVSTALPALDLALGSPQGAPQTALRGLSLRWLAVGSGCLDHPGGTERPPWSRSGLGPCGGQLAAACMPPPAGHHRNG